jgi:hypothetical protein
MRGRIVGEMREVTNGSVTFGDGTTVKVKLRSTVEQIVPKGADFTPIDPSIPEDTAKKIHEALAELGVRESGTILIETQATHDEVKSSLGDPRNDRIELIPAGTGFAEQVVLYQDELGGLSWHFPEGSFGRERSHNWRDGTPHQVFSIPGRTPINPIVGDRTRGPIAALGRKVFKVLVLPVLAELLRDPLKYIVAKAESRCVRTLIRRVTAIDYKENTTGPLSDWSAIAEGRALLILHGAFSSTAGALSSAGEQQMQALCEAYQGRVISFDHPTVSESPEENAEFFLSELSKHRIEGQQFEFDVLCHSRGGLVARTMIEQGSTLVPGHPCTFRKAYFVATPNKGTVLADPKHMLEMIDLFTNLITAFPDGPTVYSLEVVLSLIKLVAYSGLRSLPGLAAMAPDGLVSELNKKKTNSTTKYAAAAARFAPDRMSDENCAKYLLSAMMKRVFAQGEHSVANDLVVPSEGVYELNGCSLFPIEETLIYEPKHQISHSGFFSNKRTINSILKHFVDM